MSEGHLAASDPPADIVEEALTSLHEWWGRIHEAAGGSARVPTSQMRALTIIERHHELTLGSLAHELGAIPSSATRLCDRLEAAGLVERDVNPSSRREVVVRLTRAGAALLEELRDCRVNAVEAALSGMSRAEQQAVTGALQALREAAFGSGALRGLPGEDRKP